MQEDYDTCLLHFHILNLRITTPLSCIKVPLSPPLKQRTPYTMAIPLGREAFEQNSLLHFTWLS